MSAKRGPRRRFAHFDDYVLNDSPVGIIKARRRAYRWIDLNFHVTADGHIVCTHWSRPLLHGWFDPERELPARRPVCAMTLAQVRRLRNHDHPSARIYTAQTMLRMAKQYRLGVEFEAKDSPQFASSDAPWLKLRRIVDRTGVRLQVKTIVPLGAGLNRLERAKRYGFTTIALRKRPPLPAFVDYYRP